MDFLYIGVPLVIAGIILYIVLVRHWGKKRLLREAEENLDKPPAPDRTPEWESVTEYFFTAEQRDISADSITWNDLDMDGLFSRINTCESSVGEEFLYALLHRRLSGGEEERFRGLLKRLGDDRELRVRVCAALRKLGLFNYNGVARKCFGDEGFGDFGKEAVYVVILAAPAVLAAVFLCLELFFPMVITLIAGLFVIFGTYFRNQRKTERQTGTMRYLCGIICCAGALGKLCPDEEIFRRLGELCKPFSGAARRIAKISSGGSGDVLTDTVQFCTGLVTLRDVRYCCYVRRIVEGRRDILREMYDLIGTADAVCAALNLRGSADRWCEPEFTDERALRTVGMVHPLIEEPVPNSFDMTGNVLVTGSNASGKSSFIKALAVNILLAQSVFTCTAEKFQLRRCGVTTSMAARDDIGAGDSYFTAEVKSLKRLVDAASREYRFCAVDEILRGTNTVERIAASEAVLGAMAETESLFIAATHDIELTTALAGKYRNVHFSETVEEDGVRFDYTVKEGPADSRNAIKLMEVYGFPEGIVAEARSRASRQPESPPK